MTDNIGSKEALRKLSIVEKVSLFEDNEADEAGLKLIRDNSNNQELFDSIIGRISLNPPETNVPRYELAIIAESIARTSHTTNVLVPDEILIYDGLIELDGVDFSTDRVPGMIIRAKGKDNYSKILLSREVLYRSNLYKNYLTNLAACVIEETIHLNQDSSTDHSTLKEALESKKATLKEVEDKYKEQVGYSLDQLTRGEMIYDSIYHGDDSPLKSERVKKDIQKLLHTLAPIIRRLYSGGTI